MDKSEYFVLAVLALTASATVVTAIKPRTYVMDRVAVRVSNAEIDEGRRVMRDVKRRTVFSVNCEMGGRVVSIDYSAPVEE
jgi:hypothetical protein